MLRSTDTHSIRFITTDVCLILALAYSAFAATALAVVLYDEAEDEEGGSEELGSVVKDKEGPEKECCCQHCGRKYCNQTVQEGI